MLPTSCLCSIDWIGCVVVLLRPTLCCSIPHPNPIQQPGCSTTTHRRSCCRPGHPPTGRRVHAPCAHRTALHHLPVPQRSFSESPAKTSQHWRRRFFHAGASTTTARFLRGCFQRLVWSNKRHTRWHESGSASSRLPRRPVRMTPHTTLDGLAMPLSDERQHPSNRVELKRFLSCGSIGVKSTSAVRARSTRAQTCRAPTESSCVPCQQSEEAGWGTFPTWVCI